MVLKSFNDVKQILMYPKEGQGRLSINTEDYLCLGIDQFLNDKIIDFYLKYLWENLPVEVKSRVHIFSTFFYKRLTTKPCKSTTRKSTHHSYETDANLSAAEKRHCRVKNWTKKINLFEKDFIIVPINENAHWFLAIICFPGLQGAQTLDGKPYSQVVKTKKKKSTSEVKKEIPLPCDDPLLSDKDEADSEDFDESDESEDMASTPESAASAIVNTSQLRSKGKVPIKQPCILIFDSLAGPGRGRVLATLRDYLTVEYKTKMEGERVFHKDIIKGSFCKVPQQTNFTDCGLYLLQYVEEFFKSPIKDYNIPIKGIDNWFDEIVVTKKREDICNLLKELMIKDGISTNILPEIVLPTLNGKLIDRPTVDRDMDTGEEQQDMFTDIEDSEMTDETSANATVESQTALGGETASIDESLKDVQKSGAVGLLEAESDSPKPALSEPPKQASNKDTLSYLKAKRIIRHKPALLDTPDVKKFKFDG